MKLGFFAIRLNKSVVFSSWQIAHLPPEGVMEKLFLSSAWKHNFLRYFVNFFLDFVIIGMTLGWLRIFVTIHVTFLAKLKKQIAWFYSRLKDALMIKTDNEFSLDAKKVEPSMENCGNTLLDITGRK